MSNICLYCNRAPSYASNSRFSSFRADDDNESLLKHDRSPSQTLKQNKTAIARPVSQTPTIRASRERRKRLQGWRFGVAVSARVALTVFGLNLIFTIVGVTKFGDTIKHGVGTAYEGSCDTVDSWATWLHIAINILSSILLSASNYTMQVRISRDIHSGAHVLTGRSAAVLERSHQERNRSRSRQGRLGGCGSSIREKHIGQDLMAAYACLVGECSD